MRVLHVNKYHHRRGGAETTVFAFERLLADAGHEVVPFAMAHPENEPSPWSAHFVSQVRHDRPSPRAALRALGFGVRRPLRRLLAAARPDVALIHNAYHQLGLPGLLDELAARDVPAVLFLHDARVVCPAHTLLRDGRWCEDCAGSRFRHAFFHGCGGSRAHGLVLAWSAARERRRLGTVRAFLAPSRFLAEKIAVLGFPHPVRFLRNPVAPADPVPGGVAFGFAGRLAREKGVEVLRDAAARAPELSFRVAGDGPARLDWPPNVTLLGRLPPEVLARERAGWRAEVVPSLAGENCPHSVLEAFALGLPVVSSDRGGLPELVEGRGIVVPAGDAGALAAALRAMDAGRARELGALGRAFVRDECAPGRIVRELVTVLEAARC